MKVSKRDLFKLIGGGSLAAGIAATHGSLARASGQGIPFPKGGGLVDEPVARIPPDVLRSYEDDGSQWDVTEANIFDTVRIPVGREVPSCLNFFSVPAFHTCPYSGSIKTYADTNVYTSGGMFAPPRSVFVNKILISFYGLLPVREHIVSGISYGFEQRAPNDWSWEFKLMDKIYARGSVQAHKSFDFENRKGLFIPPSMNYAFMIAMRDRYRNEGKWDAAVTVTMRGLEWRPLQ